MKNELKKKLAKHNVGTAIIAYSIDGIPKYRFVMNVDSRVKESHLIQHLKLVVPKGKFIACAIKGFDGITNGKDITTG